MSTQAKRTYLLSGTTTGVGTARIVQPVVAVLPVSTSCCEVGVGSSLVAMTRSRVLFPPGCRDVCCAGVMIEEGATTTLACLQGASARRPRRRAAERSGRAYWRARTRVPAADIPACLGAASLGSRLTAAGGSNPFQSSDAAPAPGRCVRPGRTRRQTLADESAGTTDLKAGGSSPSGRTSTALASINAAVGDRESIICVLVSTRGRGADHAALDLVEGLTLRSLRWHSARTASICGRRRCRSALGGVRPGHRRRSPPTRVTRPAMESGAERAARRR